MPAVTREKRVPEWKVKLVEELANEIKNHRSILIADLTGFPTSKLQELRKKFSNKAFIKVVKPKLLAIALSKAGIDAESTGLAQYLTGQIAVIISDLNAFEINMLLDKYKSYTYYKPGDIAVSEIVIPEGDTGIPPGPMLSVFGRLKIPTKVVGNSIQVAKDTVVAKPGDTISAELASLLQKLDLPLKEVRLKIKVAYDGGVVIPGEKLVLNIDEYVGMIKAAVSDYLKIGIEIALPEPEILRIVLAKAHMQALSLAAETAFVTPETVEYIVRVAHSRAMALAAAIADKVPELGLQVQVAPQPAKQPAAEEKKEEKKEEEKKEETISEDQLAEGLGALFGM
ncbi:50S ribosomal protein L10 [Thermogladius sp. 4427co]|uniref:50S ribosomal protein L10 n=1 Tax=Thermogladius sp. 4427co TaxID=3450718 RepID=UPI003F7A0A48